MSTSCTQMRRAPMSRNPDEASTRPSVDRHRRSVDDKLHRVQKMSAAPTQSKAFRARLQLPDHELSILDKWAKRNCALHSMFSASDRGRGTVLIGLRAAPQSSASFARTIRSALRRFGVSTSSLRGHWLSCITEREAISVCLGLADHPATEQLHSSGRLLPSQSVRDSDERVVELLR